MSFSVSFRSHSLPKKRFVINTLTKCNTHIKNHKETAYLNHSPNCSPTLKQYSVLLKKRNQLKIKGSDNTNAFFV